MVECNDIVGEAITLSPTDDLDGLFNSIRIILDGCAPAGPQLATTCMPVELPVPGLFTCDYECTGAPPTKRETSNTIVLTGGIGPDKRLVDSSTIVLLEFNANSLEAFLNTIFATCPNDALTVNSCQNS